MQNETRNKGQNMHIQLVSIKFDEVNCQFKNIIFIKLANYA